MAKQKEASKVEQVIDDPANDQRPDATPVPIHPADPGLEVRAQGPVFKPVPLSESPYQRGFQKFDSPGDTFAGYFDRCISKNDDDAIGKYDAISMYRYPDGAPTLLPGNEQLWSFFNEVVAQGADPVRTRHLFSVTLTEVVPDKDDPTKVGFKRFAIGEEDRPAFYKPENLKG